MPSALHSFTSMGGEVFFFGRGPGVDKNKMAFGKLGTRRVHFISVLLQEEQSFFSAGKISSLANHVLVFFY